MTRSGTSGNRRKLTAPVGRDQGGIALKEPPGVRVARAVEHVVDGPLFHDLPAYITATRSHSSAISPRLCETNRMEPWNVAGGPAGGG